MPRLIGLIVLNNPSYVYQAWHGSLITIACVGVTVLFNTFLARKLPLIEGALVAVHIFGFFGVLVTLWVLSPTGDPKSVFVRVSTHDFRRRNNAKISHADILIDYFQ